MTNTLRHTQIRVLCVDDLPDIRAVMRMLIDAEIDMECVGELANADHLLENVSRTRAEVVLLDATLGGAAKDAMVAMRELADQCPQARTIIYSAWDDRAFNERAKAAGAWGCVSKDAPSQAVVQAIREVAAGRTCFPNAVKTL